MKEIWKRRREALAKFNIEGIKGWTLESGHCRFHHWFAHWCPACVTVRDQLRQRQALEIAKMNRHHVDLRPPLARCNRFP